MHSLQNVNLPNADANDLLTRQGEVDGAGDFAARVALAKQKFRSKPRALFRRIRANLKTVSGDLVRCGYCEDSCADEVEHIAPKDFYPELVFDWSNYLFSCGPCNGGKSNKYSVVTDAGIVELPEHREENGTVEPPAGQQLFINPRQEDPLAFLWLDLSGTFRFTPLEDDDNIARQRGEKTIEYLKLNREMLVEARRNAFSGYRDRLQAYEAAVSAGDSEEALANRAFELRRTPHRTVWLEMKRQRAAIPAIDALFVQVPAAIGW